MLRSNQSHSILGVFHIGIRCIAIAWQTISVMNVQSAIINATRREMVNKLKMSKETLWPDRSECNSNDCGFCLLLSVSFFVRYRLFRIRNDKVLFSASVVW